MSRKESTGICADSACNQCERIALRKFHWNFKFCFNEFRTDCVLFACINNSEKKVDKFQHVSREPRENAAREASSFGSFRLFITSKQNIDLCRHCGNTIHKVQKAADKLDFDLKTGVAPFFLVLRLGIGGILWKTLFLTVFRRDGEGFCMCRTNGQKLLNTCFCIAAWLCSYNLL